MLVICMVVEKNSRYCKHDKLITTCKECCKNFCIHEILKYRCKECNYPGYIKSIIRVRIQSEIKKHNLRKDKSSIQYLGCNIEHLMKVFSEYYHIDKLIDNIHIDHIKPLSMFDLTNIEDVDRAFHWTNLQPLDAIQNRIKSNKWDDELEKWWEHEVQLKMDLFPFKNDDTMAECKIYTLVSNTNENTITVTKKEKYRNIKKFEDLKNEIFESIGHILLTCEFGSDRKCTYECGNCKSINSTAYHNLKKSKGVCSKCCNNRCKNDIEQMTVEIGELGFTLLNYTNNKNMLVQCKCKKHPAFTISLFDIRRGRHKCCT